MRPGRIALLAALIAAALLAPPRSAVAENDDTVVATVGNQKLTLGDVQQRLLTVPSFQLQTYGKTPDEVRKNFVEKVMVPEMLFAEEARRRKLDQDPDVAYSIRGVLRGTMLKAVKEETEKNQPVTDKDITVYYLEHKSEFNTPRRLRLWRILVADKPTAEKIIKEAQGTQGPERWMEIARGKSLDKATAMRGGNLGFVRPDGRTETPRVRVDPALFAAADKVKDGEIVPEPVKEGDDWAVVWRRGSMPAVTRTKKDEAMAIRHILRRQRVETATKNLIAKLKKEHVSEQNYKLLQYVNVDETGDVGARERPGLLPRRPPRGSPIPQQTEHGLR